MASLTTMPNSPFWLARMRVWVAAPDHPQGGFWRQTIRSTKLPLKTARRTAQRVADEMEAVGRELRSETPDSVWAQSRLDALLRAAGMSAARRRSTWEKAAQGYLAAKTAKTRSMESYRKHVAHFADFLGQRTRHDLRSITPEDISEFYHAMIKRGLSTNTAQQVTKTIRAVFTRAMHLRNIEANPAALFRMSADATPSGRKAFNQGEIAAILKVAQGEWRTCILFGLYFGMRLGDARRRSYEEIEDGNLRFLPEKKSRLGKVVTVPLMGELQTLRGKGLITPTLAAMEHGTASKHFSQLLDRAGIVRVKTTKRGQGRGLTDKTFHSWRHTTNSLLAEAGIDQRVRQLICDHDSVRVSNRYTAVSIDTMAKALTKAISVPERV
jgi:site-specific recombinase XerD